jgi:hypothetical protein
MGTKCNAISIGMLFVVSVVMVPTDTASGYGGEVHQSMTKLFVGEEFKTKYPNSEPLQYIDTIAYGAWEEDEVDFVFGYAGPYKTIPHFWDADGGPSDPVTLKWAGLEPWPNAWQKISYMNIGDYEPISPYGLWDQALLYYRSGNKVQAYSLLGHIAHLIEDMSVPAHVHEDFHDSDIYEDALNTTWTWAWAHVNRTELAKGLIDYSNIQVPGWRNDFSSLYYLLYTTNQRTDFFGSEGDDGNTGFATGDINILPGFEGVFSDFAGYSLLWYYQTPGNMEYNLWVCNICGTPLCRVGAPAYSCPNGHGWDVTEWNAPTFISTQYALCDPCCGDYAGGVPEGGGYGSSHDFDSDWAQQVYHLEQ